MDNNEEELLDKRAPEKYKNYSPEVVMICKNCNGVADCWCGHPEYKEQWKFVWQAVKNCKGV